MVVWAAGANADDLGVDAPQIGGKANLGVEVIGAVTSMGMLSGESKMHVGSVVKGNIDGSVDIDLEVTGAVTSMGMLEGKSCLSVASIGANDSCSSWKTTLINAVGGAIESVSNDIAN